MAKIQDYGIVGDCRAAALISNQGSVDWLCWPRFDSPSIFCALLDPEKGGHWSIAPTCSFTTQRRYIADSNVLETRFQCVTGRALVTDLMPVASEEFKRDHLVPDHELLREIVCIEGEVELGIDYCPRPQYGQKRSRLRNLGALGWRLDVGRGSYWMRSSVPLQVQGDRSQTTVVLKRGDSVHLSLSYAEESPAVMSALGPGTGEAIDRSIRWWQNWAAQCNYDGPYLEAVRRSALALKLLTYVPSGAITAAATTSLPEIVGSDLNWDYRYCWLRDASLTIRALLGLGYHGEAESFLEWLLYATKLTQPKLRVLYTVFGENTPREHELKYLSGYFESRPVRVGNGARNQLQLDVYGEVVDAAAQYASYGGRFDRATQKVLIGFGKYVAQNWDCPDEGIWEPRSGRQNHTHSRLMCWTALDRLLAMDQKRMLTGVPTELFTRERQRIREQLEHRAWNDHQQSYVKTLDGDELDSSLLRIPWYGFEHADSERMRKTYADVEQKLGAGGDLLYRYERKPREGAFGICGFWAAEYLAIGGGSIEQARRYFEKLLEHRNDLGLCAEEIDPNSGDALGNFPQAFTHVGLISAALSIAERERGEAHPAHKVRHETPSSPSEAHV